MDRAKTNHVDLNEVLEGLADPELGTLRPAPNGSSIALSIAGPERGLYLAYANRRERATLLVKGDVRSFQWDNAGTSLFVILPEPLRLCRIPVTAPQSCTELFREPRPLAWLSLHLLEDGGSIAARSTLTEGTEDRIFSTSTGKPWHFAQASFPLRGEAHRFSGEFAVLTSGTATQEVHALTDTGPPRLLIRDPEIQAIRGYSHGLIVATSKGLRPKLLYAETPEAGQVKLGFPWRDASHTSGAQLQGTVIEITVPGDSDGLTLPPTDDFSSREPTVIAHSLTEPDRLCAVSLREKRLICPESNTATRYVAKLERVVSGDGTLVPLTLMNAATSGMVFVRSYGAYGTSLRPEFQPEHVPLLKRDVSLALCHARGGGELGPTWYEQGRGDNKEHTAADIAACIAHLRAVGFRKVILFSRSAGAVSALTAASAAKPDAMVLESPYVTPVQSLAAPRNWLDLREKSEWGSERTRERIDPFLHLSAMDGIPLLIRSGNADAITPLADVGRYAQALSRNNPETKITLLISEGDHEGEANVYEELRVRAVVYGWALRHFSGSLK